MNLRSRLSIVTNLAAFALVCGACQSPQNVAHTVPSHDDNAYVIRLDGPSNGPPTVPAVRSLERRFDFEVAGFAQASAEADADQRMAARQAAIIEALGRALIEIRRGRGQPTDEFTARIGPRLTISRRRLADGYELQVLLVARGEETAFIVRDGVLQHPPQDFAILQKVFQETDGEFVLLASDRTLSGDACEARVACYRPAVLDTSLAGDARDEDEANP